MSFNPLDKRDAGIHSHYHTLDEYASKSGKEVDNTLALTTYDMAVRSVDNDYIATVNIPAGVYSVNVTSHLSSIVGVGSLSRLRPFDNTKPVIILSNEVLRNGWDNTREIKNIGFECDGSDGIVFGDLRDGAGKFEFKNIDITNADIAIKKTRGNIGQTYHRLSVSHSNIGVYALSTPDMHAGNDLMSLGEMHGIDKACWYIHSPHKLSRSLTCRDVIFQACGGFGIFWRFPDPAVTGINKEQARVAPVIERLHMEQVATSATVNIDGNDYAPREIRIDNCRLAIIRETSIESMELKNTKIIAQGCKFPRNGKMYFDSDSQVISRDTVVNGRCPPAIMVESFGSIGDLHQDSATPCTARMPLKTFYSGPAYGTVVSGNSFSGAGPHSFDNSVSMTSISGGIISRECCNIILPASTTIKYEDVTLLTGKWYVAIVHVKATSAVMTCQITGTEVMGDVDLTNAQEWVCFVGIKRGNGGTTALTFSNTSLVEAKTHLADMSIVQFDHEHEAIDYANSGGVRIS